MGKKMYILQKRFIVRPVLDEGWSHLWIEREFTNILIINVKSLIDKPTFTNFTLTDGIAANTGHKFFQSIKEKKIISILRLWVYYLNLLFKFLSGKRMLCNEHKMLNAAIKSFE